MSMAIDSTALVTVRAVVKQAGNPISNTNPIAITVAELMKAGGFAKGVAVPNAVAAPTKAEFDALLVSLRNAGLIAT